MRNRRETGGFRAGVGELLGLDETAGTADPIVGWMVPLTTSVRGSAHVCVRCSLRMPRGTIPVYRHQLAATERCTRCRVVLEEIGA